jgi:aspartate/methionine/tyrosine aminotransferase
MSQGVPGIPPPEGLRAAIAQASASPDHFSYCRWDGEPSLRSALVEEMKAVYRPHADIKIEDVALTAGCNLAFVAVVMTLADAGNEIILPVPW